MTTGDSVDCRTYPAENLKTMFVDIVQKSRIDAGERPALRTVFHKVHGAAYGVLRMRPDVPEGLRVGLFALDEVPAWVRFSSDIHRAHRISGVHVGNWAEAVRGSWSEVHRRAHRHHDGSAHAEPRRVLRRDGHRYVRAAPVPVSSMVTTAHTWRRTRRRRPFSMTWPSRWPARSALRIGTSSRSASARTTSSSTSWCRPSKTLRSPRRRTSRTISPRTLPLVSALPTLDSSSWCRCRPTRP